MGKYSKIIEGINSIKQSENYSSNDAIIIKCLVDCLLKDKLNITKLLNLEVSMFYAINVIYSLIELDCKDETSKYLRKIMPKSKREANSLVGDIYRDCNLGEEVQVKLNDKYNTVRYEKRKSTIGLIINFFEDKAIERGKVDKKLINC